MKKGRSAIASYGKTILNSAEPLSTEEQAAYFEKRTREWFSNTLGQLINIAHNHRFSDLSEKLCVKIIQEFGHHDDLGIKMMNELKLQRKGKQKGSKMWPRYRLALLLTEYSLFKNENGSAAALVVLSEKYGVKQKTIANKITEARKIFKPEELPEFARDVLTWQRPR